MVIYYKTSNKIKKAKSNFSMYVRSLFWKRRSDCILFGSWSGTRFADNTRYLYQYLHENKFKYGIAHVVWVTRNNDVYSTMKKMGYEVYMMDSKESIYFHKHSMIHFICNTSSRDGKYEGDIEGQYSFGAYKVNLWHGLGNKSIGLLSGEYRERFSKHPIFYKIKNIINLNSKLYKALFEEQGNWGSCFILCPSMALTNDMCKEFLRKQKDFIFADYPRHSRTIQLTKEEERILNRINNASKVILYVPTFRDGANVPDFSSIAARILNKLDSDDILWIQKIHTADDKKYEMSTSLNNIVTLDSNFDINTIIPYIDIIITDYSSVASDGMYFFKPVVYYVPDFENFKNSSNGFLVDPHEIMKGPCARNEFELVDYIAKTLQKPECAKYEGYDMVRDYYWNVSEDISIVWQKIIEKIGLKSNYIK